MELEGLRQRLREEREEHAVLALLYNHEKVQSMLLVPHYKELYLLLKSPEHQKIFLLLMVLEALPLFFDPAKKTKPLPAIEALLSQMALVDKFYQEIGGLLGYVHQVQRLLRGGARDLSHVTLSAPHSESIEKGGVVAKHAATFALAHLDRIALMVAAGGLGARLGLVDEHNHSLPVAYLPFMGRSLLEGLVRDLEGLEELYYKSYGRRIVIPMALMTSKEQNNHENIKALFEKHNYFGRPRATIRLFSQLSVPVLTIEGGFAASGPAEFLFHPSGHGAIWKTAEEAGVFTWLQEQRIEHLLIRQVNNPLAALDYNLLAFLGLMIRQNKGFGFIGCEPMKGASEGALVAMQEGGRSFISNIEYSEMAKEGYTGGGLANTNILYARLSQIREKLKEKTLFGPLVNMKSQVPKYTPAGHVESVRGGRLESMMQNISEAFYAKVGHALPTLVVKNSRLKTIAAIKQEYHPEKGPFESAEAAYYQLLQNNYELLARCTKEPLPLFSSLESYLEKGPSLIFAYHPILGPLYDVIVQKLHIQKVAMGSELQLEVAELTCDHLTLSGSLIVEAVQGRLILRNVTVENRGIDHVTTRSYWKGEIVRHEAAYIHIEEGGELLLENITLRGDQKIEVQANQKLAFSGTFVSTAEHFDAKDRAHN